jgi:hypothetical protein
MVDLNRSYIDANGCGRPSIKILLFLFVAVLLVDFREHLAWNGCLDLLSSIEMSGWILYLVKSFLCHSVYCVMSKALYVKLVTSFLCV